MLKTNIFVPFKKPILPSFLRFTWEYEDKGAIYVLFDSAHP